jgi:type II secretory pathway component PulF
MGRELELEPDIDLSEKRAVVMALGTMIQVGIPILTAIERAKDKFAQSQRMKDALQMLLLGVKAGHPLDKALPKERFPELDDGIFFPLISVGEETGELDILLLKAGKIYGSELQGRPSSWFEYTGAQMHVSQYLQLYIDAGLPILRSLALIKRVMPGAGYPQMAEALGVVIEEIESGSTLSESLAVLPKFFSEPFVAMIRSGEEAGALERVLDKINLH